MNDDELLQLKGWGHQLLALEAEHRKVSKTEVYQLIHGKIKRNPHFSRMKTEEEVREVIYVLLRWMKKRSQTNKKPDPNSKKSKAKREEKEEKEIARLNKSVPMDEIQKAIRRLPKRKIPWWRRWIRSIRNLYA